MKGDEVYNAVNRLVDGQQVRVLTVSGRVFDGIYDAEKTDPDGFFYFETMEGNALRAAWSDISELEFRSARASAGRMFMPPEHPLSGQGPVGVTATGLPRRAHTSRNS